MSDYTLGTTVTRPFSETVDLVRAGLAAEGFGVITEIDLSATLRAKLGVDMPPQIILGACRPELAHQALLADPSIAALLPCNVVVRSTGDTTTEVEAFDPALMAGLTVADLRVVAKDARGRLQNMFDTLPKEN